MNGEVIGVIGMTMDEDIAHLARVMVPSLSAFRGEPVLQPAYWRRRLHRIQSEYRLTDTQASQIQHLLGDLDKFEAERIRPSYSVPDLAEPLRVM